MKMPNWRQFVGGTAVATAVAVGGYFEGERLVAYHDPGDGRPTICDGETHGVFMGMTKTHEECQALLNAGMDKEVAFVRSQLIKPAKDNVLAAFGDFTYNEGEGQFAASSMKRDWNLGHYTWACDDLHKFDGVWIRADGKKSYKILPGLVARREIEYQLCMEGTK